MPASRQSLLVDPNSGHTIAMGEVHARIHEGVLFQVAAFAESVADDGDLTFLVRTVAGVPAHMRIEGGAGGDSVLQVFENPTISNDGSAVTPSSRNRLSSNTASTLFFTGPTASNDGTDLTNGGEFHPGGSGPRTPGSVKSGFEEWILKANEEYLVRVTNLAGNAQPLSLLLTFYETN